MQALIGPMGDFDNRQITRDSLFIMAELRLDGNETIHRVKVRNLSAGGLMAEGPVKVGRGLTAWVNLRNAGWIEGAVAWVQDNRFGIAFHHEIDPKVVRANTVSPHAGEAVVRNRLWAAPPPPAAPPRKIF